MFDSHDEDEDVSFVTNMVRKAFRVFTDKGASQNPYGVFTAFISHSPQFGRALGFAFLPNDTENIGSSVFIETSWTCVRGSVCFTFSHE